MSASPLIFLDANILLEIILGRPNEPHARTLITKYSDDVCISTLTAHLIVHFGQVMVELPVLQKFLTDYTVFPLDPVDFEWAFTNARNKDFEDALQLAVAIRHGCTSFMTFDKGLVTTYEDLPQIKVHLVA